MTIEFSVPGARALIEPAYGGRLHQLFIEIDGVEHPLLRAPDDPADYRLDPLGGGSFPMAPWPNRIRDGRFLWSGREYRVPLDADGEALHGLVFDKPWQVLARVGRVVEMTCDFGPAWPWEGRAWQRIELGPGYLAMKMEVRSAREAFPAGCGWHPWFRRDFAGSGTVAVRMQAAHRYEMNDHLPTGKVVEPAGEHLLDGSPLGGRVLDDCYTRLAPAVATITWERLTLTMQFEHQFAHAQVYTPANVFCIEPQTCAPDAFNLATGGSVTDGSAVVAPGRPLGFTCRWTWKT